MGLTFKKEDRLESMLEDFGIELPEESKDKFSFKATVESDKTENNENQKEEKKEK